MCEVCVNCMELCLKCVWNCVGKNVLVRKEPALVCSVIIFIYIDFNSYYISICAFL